MSRDESEVRRFKEGAWVVVWRWGTAIMVGVGTCVGSYAMMWVKLNAPTRAEFGNLVQTVQGLREDMLTRAGHERQINDHEARLRVLEQRRPREP